MYIFQFEKLDVWTDTKNLINDIYQLTLHFPAAEKYGLCNQVRRAAISISLNIAEGSGRKLGKDQALFYRYAYSSCLETIAGLIIARNLEYIEDADMKRFRETIRGIAFQLNSLSRSTINRSQSQK